MNYLQATRFGHFTMRRFLMSLRRDGRRFVKGNINISPEVIERVQHAQNILDATMDDIDEALQDDKRSDAAFRIANTSKRAVLVARMGNRLHGAIAAFQYPVHAYNEMAILHERHLTQRASDPSHEADREQNEELRQMLESARDGVGAMLEPGMASMDRTPKNPFDMEETPVGGAATPGEVYEDDSGSDSDDRNPVS